MFDAVSPQVPGDSRVSGLPPGAVLMAVSDPSGDTIGVQGWIEAALVEASEQSVTAADVNFLSDEQRPDYRIPDADFGESRFAFVT